MEVYSNWYKANKGWVRASDKPKGCSEFILQLGVHLEPLMTEIQPESGKLDALEAASTWPRGSLSIGNMYFTHKKRGTRSLSIVSAINQNVKLR
jgi:hypothetical protein